MRWGVLAAFAGGCTPTVAQIDAPPPPIEAGPDTVQMVPACPADPTLSICLAFDAPQLASPYANEGALALSAMLTSVTRTEAPNSGAALLSATSEIVFAPNTQIVNIVAVDLRLRFDVDVPAGGRVGLMDSDKASPGMSLFVYSGTTTSHRVRCNLGGVDLYADTSIPLGTWIDLGCTCEAGNVAVRRDGVKIAELGGTTTCAPGAATTTGLQIGQNSRAGDGLPPNEPFVGAIDRVRLWTRVP